MRSVSINEIVTLRSSLHVRVKYPWQEEEEKAQQDSKQKSKGASDEGSVTQSSPSLINAIRNGDDRPRVHTRPLGAKDELIKSLDGRQIQRFDGSEVTLDLEGQRPRVVTMSWHQEVQKRCHSPWLLL